MRIGSRGSSLALIQATWVAENLLNGAGLASEIVTIETVGDRVTDRPLREIEGRGYFTKEIEEALLDRRIDIAVHSFKDMPSKTPDGLVVAAVTIREDPADLLIIRPQAYDPIEREIPVKVNAIVGTSAVRRETQLKALRRDVISSDLRGNVPTRLKKLESGQYDAIFLASAGIRRLKMDLFGYHVIRLDPTRFIPSPGQGALAIQMRDGDPLANLIRATLHHEPTQTSTAIERQVQARFGGGCGLPLGVFAHVQGSTWHAHGFWGGNPDEPLWAHVSGEKPDLLAEELFLQLEHVLQ